MKSIGNSNFNWEITANHSRILVLLTIQRIVFLLVGNPKTPNNILALARYIMITIEGVE